MAQGQVDPNGKNSSGTSYKSVSYCILLIGLIADVSTLRFSFPKSLGFGIHAPIVLLEI